VKHSYKSALSIIVALFLIGFSDSTLNAASSWEEQWNRTVEAAKKEGKLNTYGLADITHPAILEAFNKRYPEIKVVTVTGHTEVIQRIVAERRAGKYVADVFSSGPAILRQAYSAKFLQPIRPILMLPDVTDTTKWYGGKHLWNDPEEKYLLIFEGTPGSASMAYTQISSLTLMRFSPCRGIEEAQKIGLPVESIHGNHIKEAGELGSGNSSVLGFFDRAPHPNAAIVFVNWFLSREGQMRWQKVLNTIVVNGSDSMRIDIPKDDVVPGSRRAQGREYPMLGFVDPKTRRQVLLAAGREGGTRKKQTVMHHFEERLTFHATS
jgi:ABC-type glycerol-3-phosphate transport system substrate-binding protein